MAFHQVIVGAAPGDASTNDALALRDLLRGIGPSDIFAYHIDPGLAGEVYPLAEFDSRAIGAGGSGLLIFHVTIGEPVVFAFARSRPERLVIRYHNIAPADAFRQDDPGYAELLDSGRRDLPTLSSKCVLALADSPFNARELVELGYRDVRVSHLVIDTDRLLELPDDEPTARWLDSLGGPVVLSVGQLSPHKRPDYLLSAFHILSTYLVPEAHLVILGSHRHAAFSSRVVEFKRQLSLGRAHLLGSVTDSVLATCYRRAAVFATASEHEGFCVPVAEAMPFGLPVVARGFAAVPEVLGGAGILLPPDGPPALLAEALATVLQDGGLRGNLAAMGRERGKAFSAAVARAQFLDHLLSVA